LPLFPTSWGRASSPFPFFLLGARSLLSRGGVVNWAWMLENVKLSRISFQTAVRASSVYS
jgi:hypothetical protein